MKYLILLIITSFSLTSCYRTGIIDGVKVEFVRPKRSVFIDSDTSVNDKFVELQHCHALKIVGDTLLVFQEQTNQSNPLHFKAYSTNTFEYLGAFAYHGRGPEEMVAPHIAKSHANNAYLPISDNPVGKAYLVDVEKSTVHHMPKSSERIIYPRI